MNQKGFIEVTRINGVDQVRINGPLTAMTGTLLLELFEKAGPHCVINMKNVSYIDSFGIRHWMSFIKRFSATRQVKLEECTLDFSLQVLLLNGVLGQAKVNSFYATFFCNKCSHEESHLYDLTKLSTTSGEIDATRVCSGCGDLMHNHDDIGLLISRMTGKQAS